MSVESGPEHLLSTGSAFSPSLDQKWSCENSVLLRAWEMPGKVIQISITDFHRRLISIFHIPKHPLSFKEEWNTRFVAHRQHKTKLVNQSAVNQAYESYWSNVTFICLPGSSVKSHSRLSPVYNIDILYTVNNFIHTIGGQLPHLISSFFQFYTKRDKAWGRIFFSLASLSNVFLYEIKHFNRRGRWKQPRSDH